MSLRLGKYIGGLALAAMFTLVMAAPQAAKAEVFGGDEGRSPGNS